MVDRANPIRFGILGCAAIARKVSRAIALAPNATVVAVGSRSLDKAQRFIADNGLPPATRAHGSYEAVLDDLAVDAVYVPLPTSLHVRWAVAAAEHGKHVLLEKPTALCAVDLDRILEACGSQGVQFMDSTMWMHHPRTARMREFLSDPNRFGQLKAIHSSFTYGGGDPGFLQNDIRVKPDLDALGALGDAGWYCIRSILWAADYELPRTAIAHHGCVKNQAGVILSCGATLVWDDSKVATFYCSFLTTLTMELSVMGTRGTLHLSDFVIPFEETAAKFRFATDSGFKELQTGWHPLPSELVISTDLPQEALMIQEFARLAGSIRDSGSKPDEKWPIITRKTQLVLDAVKESIEKGFEPVNVTG